MDDKIIESLINQMAGQIDLLITLSTALCGGIVALWIQVAKHNSDRSNIPILIRGALVQLNGKTAKCNGY